MTKHPVIRTVSATEARYRFGEMLKGVYQRAEHVVVERSGIPVAVIVPIQDYEQLIDEGDLSEEMVQELGINTKEVRARSRLRQFLSKAREQMPDVSENEVEQDIKEAIQAVRRKT